LVGVPREMNDLLKSSANYFSRFRKIRETRWVASLVRHQ